MLPAPCVTALAAVPTTCMECPTSGSSPGTRRIHPGNTGSVFTSLTCNLPSFYTSLPRCTRFWFTGSRQAVDCGSGTKRCFAQVQLSAAGGGTNYWLLDHTCGNVVDSSSIVDDDNEQCGGSEWCRGSWAGRLA